MQSETIGAIADALAKAQGAIKPAPMDRDNPFFKSKYATLTSLWESARAALSANGLAFVQTTDINDAGELVLLSTLMHASGEWVGSVYPVRAKDNTPQALGSALTYARRYAFGALVGLTSDDDDDGNGAQNGANGSQKAPVAKEVQPKSAPPAAANERTATGNASTNGGAAGNGKSTGAARAFHAAGSKLYGQDWDTKRHEIVKAYTRGRTTSSAELTPDEMAFLTSRLDEKLKQQLAAVTVEASPEMDPDGAEVFA